MNTHTAALVAALTDAIEFAEVVYGPNAGLASRTTAKWRTALAAVTNAPADDAEIAPAIKFHLDQAADAMAEVWDHLLAIIEQMPDCEISEVLETVQALAVDTPIAGDNVKPSDIPLTTLTEILAAWQATNRRRRRAKGLPA